MNEDTGDSPALSIQETGSLQDVSKAYESKRPPSWYPWVGNTNGVSATFTSDKHTQDNELWALYQALLGKLRTIEFQARTTRSLLQERSKDTFWDQGVEVVAIPLGTIREIETLFARILAE